MVPLRPSLSLGSRVFVTAIGLCLLAGCGERGVTTAPDTGTEPFSVELVPSPVVTPDASLPYPLAVGNRWQHVRNFDVFERGSEGEWSPITSITADVERTIVGVTDIAERPYFLQRETTTERGTTDPPFNYIFGVRQDRAGLYEWDGGDALASGTEALVAASAAPAPSRMSEVMHEIERRSPEHARKLAMLERVVLPTRWLGARERGGRLPGELLRLAYPLRPRARWIVRQLDGSALVATVMEFGPVVLPSGTERAWKIRYDWPGVYGPNDRVEVWYGRRGYLGMRARLETVGTDPREAMRTVIDERLVSALLAGR